MTSTDTPAVRASDGTRTNQLDSLTGLRFVSALLVFCTHAGFVADLFANQSVTKAIQLTLPLGMVQVSVFFVLSGLVLTWSARPGDTARGFWWRRFVKIYPNHLVTFTAMLVFVVATGVAVTGPANTGVRASGVGFGPAVANLFLVHAWIPNPDYSAGVNIVSWSLAVEALFYLLFPFLLNAVRRIPGSWLWPAALVAVALVWAAPLIAMQFSGGPTVPGVGVPEAWFWGPYYFPISRLPEFVLGMLLARIVRDGRAFRIGATVSTVLGVVCLGAGALVLPFPFLPSAITVIPVGLLIMSLAAGDVRGKKSWLRRPIPMFLGRISFAFYLVHWPVILMIDWLFGQRQWSTPTALGIVALCLAVAGVVAWLLYRFVEMAAMRRLITRTIPK
jgi:peptidoglycan/LPS O-acetylase OafA/YrhL